MRGPERLARSAGRQPHSGGVEHGLGPAAQLELAIDVREVVADRLVTDPALLGDEGDRPGLSDQGEDLKLGWRELARRSAQGRCGIVEAGYHPAHEVRAHGAVA